MRWLILIALAIFLAACPTSTRQQDERLRRWMDEQRQLQYADGFFEDDDWDLRPEHEEDDLWDPKDDGYIPWDRD